MAASPLSKSEKRIAKKAAKEAKRQEKQARQAETPPILQTARQAETVAEGKRVRIAEDPSTLMQQIMTWTADHADQEGSWSWGISRAWGDQAWNNDIHPKLQNFATMSWGQIHNAKVRSGKRSRRAHHVMPRTTICQEAQARLNTLKFADDLLFRFRLGARERLWGYRILSLFCILWYDPTHQVYSVDPP